MRENKVLLLSVYTSTFFALLGVGWGIFADSGMIIFDGIYSSISICLSLLSLLVLKQVLDSYEDARFPFGKAHFEPMVIVLKSLTLVGVCLYSAVNGFAEILAGGRYVEPGQAIIYAFISTFGCAAMTIILRRRNENIESDLLNAEANQWLGDSILSGCVLVGFSLSYLISGTRLDWLTPYADPGLLMIASTGFLIIPLRSLIASFKEIMFYKVDEGSLNVLDCEAGKIAAELHAEYKLRMVNVGRELSIELNFLLEDRTFTVAEMDTIRRRIASIAKTVNDHYWLNVNFTQIRSVL
jgi:predicted Co/Zn/Cd cation transporter (cation efflux family)